MFRKLRAIPIAKELQLIEKEAELAEFGDIKKYGVQEKHIGKGEKPEYASIEAFAQFLADDEQDFFTVEDVHSLNEQTHIPQQKITAELQGYGFVLKVREIKSSAPRGFTSKSFRWAEFR